MSPPAVPLVWIGWDPTQRAACDVAALSLLRTSRTAVSRPLSLSALPSGCYTRPIETRGPGYWDPISDAPMSTQHAIARFLVPALCEYEGWALFTDGDVLFRQDAAAVFALADPSKAVMVVPHRHAPIETVKMAGQVQTAYARKNWSSVMLFHCGHPANRALTVELVNSVPGRDLHRFCWLEDDLIGTLPPEWNYLVGHSAPCDPAIVHFTDGYPALEGYEHVEYADEWYRVAEAAGHVLKRPVRPAAVRA